MVDDEDFDFLSKYKWYVLRSHGATYAHGSLGQRRMVLMHRVVMKAPRGKHVDHVNGNGLDNQKENLRFATHSQNAANSRGQPGRHNRTSQFKGVSREGKTKWAARVDLDRLGSFETEEEAAMAYDAAAVVRWGAYARTNEDELLRRIASALVRIADAKEKQVELLHRRDVLGLR